MVPYELNQINWLGVNSGKKLWQREIRLPLPPVTFPCLAPNCDGRDECFRVPGAAAHQAGAPVVG